MQIKVTPLVEKMFFAQIEIDPKTQCWIWMGSRSYHGYGLFTVWDHVKNVKAHRFSWVLHQGNIPEGLWVRHQCDVRACVNPAHLQLGTAADNTADMMRRRRHQSQGDPVAYRRSREGSVAKLTAEEVMQARSLYATGNYSAQDLADQFGVAGSTMGHALRGGNWGHLPPLPKLPDRRRKFTEDQVREIRTIAASSAMHVREIAKLHGVHETSIGNIVRRKSYRDVE